MLKSMLGDAGDKIAEPEVDPWTQMSRDEVLDDQ